VRWLLLICLVACGPKNAQKTMRYSQFVVVGSLVGVAAATGGVAIAPNDTVKNVAIGFDVGFAALAITGVVVYLLADVNDVPEPSQTEQQRAQADAWNMTKRAREAARTGDCARVKKIAPAVKDADPSFYDVVFMRDVAIKTCMTSR
jgi:hypothetical protein